MSKKSLVYRVNAAFAGFNGLMFDQALKYALSEPFHDDVTDIIKSPEDLFNIRLSYSECSHKLMEDLKDFYKLSNDSELIRLVLHVAQNNSLFWGHTPSDQTTCEGVTTDKENNTKSLKTAKITQKGK